MHAGRCGSSRYCVDKSDEFAFYIDEVTSAPGEHHLHQLYAPSPDKLGEHLVSRGATGVFVGDDAGGGVVVELHAGFAEYGPVGGEGELFVGGFGGCEHGWVVCGLVWVRV